MPNTRRLAAIMFTDIVGYTSIMQGDEARAVELRLRHREVFEKQHDLFKGKILQYYGDGTLSIFDSAIDAANCAVAIQQELQKDPVVPIRIGIHTGDIMYSEDEVFGDGVNIASRVESLAAPGSIMISDRVFDYIKNQSDLPVKSMGVFTLKNVKKPLEIFAIEKDGIILPDPDQLEGKYTKRESKSEQESSRFTIKKIPIWLRYVGGFALFLLLAPILYFPLYQTGTNSAQGYQRIQDENGVDQTSNVIAKEDVKTFIVSAFENKSGEEKYDWLEKGIPYALEMEWDQDPHVFNIFDESSGEVSFNQYLEWTKREKMDYLLQGEFDILEDETYEIELTFYSPHSGQAVLQNSYTGQDLFPLLDKVSLETKKVLGVSESYISQIKDLPLNEYLTRSMEAYGHLIESTASRNNTNSFKYLASATEADPNFTWAHYLLSRKHHAFQRSKKAAESHIKQAMANRTVLPEVFDVQVRLLNYRIHEESEKALRLLEMLVQMYPNNSIYRSKLIEEYRQQRKYDKTLDAINAFQKQTGNPDFRVLLKAQTLMHLNREKEGIKFLSQYIEKNPQVTNVQGVLAELYASNGEWDKAKELLERVQILNPEFNAIPQLIDYVEFMKDSSAYITPKFLKELEGVYLTITGKMEFRIIAEERKLFLQVKNQNTTPLYPMNAEYYITPWGMKQRFLGNGIGGYDILETEEGKGNFYLAFRIDSLISNALDAFSKQQFEEAEPLLQAAMQAHPKHNFLDKYLEHIAFRKTADFVAMESELSKFVGSFSTESFNYTISVEDGILTLQSEENTSYIDPVRLFPIGKDLFMVEGNFGQQIEYKKRGSQYVAFDFMNFDGQKFYAKKN